MYTPLHAIERTNADNNLLMTKIHITISIKIQEIESPELETIRYCSINQLQTIRYCSINQLQTL